jgi:hypothetical protein
MDEYLDLDFFQRCFFGRKLHSRDQLIFKIYAKELFDLIEKKRPQSAASLGIIRKKKRSMPLSNPSSLIGYSKRQAERLQLARNFED